MFNLKIKNVELFWKPLGETEYSSKTLEREARSVNELNLDESEYGNNSFEYYIIVSLDIGELSYPLEGNASVTVW